MMVGVGLSVSKEERQRQQPVCVALVAAARASLEAKTFQRSIRALARPLTSVAAGAFRCKLQALW